jgi:hypothetical protein
MPGVDNRNDHCGLKPAGTQAGKLASPRGLRIRQTCYRSHPEKMNFPARMRH